MGAKLRAVCVTAVIAGLAGFGWLVLRPHEPRYQGKPVSYWLSRSIEARWYGGARDETELDQGEAALRSLGSNAVPFLLEMASHPPRRWRFVVGQLARQRELAFLHLPPQLYKMELAIWGFNVLGSEATPAVPRLARLLRDSDLEARLTAAYGLGSIGPTAAGAVPALVSALRPFRPGDRTNEVFQTAVVQALGRIGPGAEAALPILANWTNECAQLAVLQIRGASLLPFLDRLQDTSNVERWVRSARLVQRLGTNAGPAIPWLLTASEHTNHAIQNSAVHILGELRLRPDLCVPRLVRVLQSTNDSLRASSLYALSLFGPAAKAAAPDVARCCQDRQAWIRNHATNALRSIDPAALRRSAGKAQPL